MRFLNYLSALLILFNLSANAQDVAAVKKTGWEISYTKGLSFGGPSLDYSGSGFECRLRSKNYSPDILSIIKPIYKFFGAGIVTGKVNLDMLTVSQHFGHHYPCDFRTFFFSPSLTLSYKIFNLEAGPSFNFIDYYHIIDHLGPGANIYDNQNYSTVGFLVKSAIRFPPKSIIFFKAEIQYLDEGIIKPPITQTTGFRQYIDINPYNLSLSSWYIGAGAGIRFLLKKQKNQHINYPSGKIIGETSEIISIHPLNLEAGIGAEQSFDWDNIHSFQPAVKVRYGKNFQPLFAQERI